MVFKPLPIFREELKEILIEDLSSALDALKELLPKTSEKHIQLLALIARFKDATKESRFYNTINSEKYQRRIDTIRKACFVLVENLKESDFSTILPPHKSDNVALKQGSILYRVPRQMLLHKHSICMIRVALSDEDIQDNLVFDEQMKIKSRVKVSDMMKAELIDPGVEVFIIRPLNAPEQLVHEEGHTQWLFSVIPRMGGEHQLLVKISTMQYMPNLKKHIPHEVSILETVTIFTEDNVLLDNDISSFKSAGYEFTLNPEVDANENSEADILILSYKAKYSIESIRKRFEPLDFSKMPTYMSDNSMKVLSPPEGIDLLPNQLLEFKFEHPLAFKTRLTVYNNKQNQLQEVIIPIGLDNFNLPLLFKDNSEFTPGWYYWELSSRQEGVFRGYFTILKSLMH